MKEITLLRGNVAQVSDEDFEYLNQWNWHEDSKGYAKITINCVSIRMHQLILKRMSLSGQCDHKDQNKLNNQRFNLRLATTSQNQANRPTSKRNTSGFKGVSFDRQQNKFVTNIGYKKRVIHLDRFDSAIEAAQAYDRAAKRLFGEFACVNFPEQQKHGQPAR